jgi:hypothetical protein
MIGMLWFDNSKDPLEKKILRAAAYYLAKYGMDVNTVIVHPLDLDDSQVPGVAIIPSHECQRHHLLVSEETVGS